MGTTEITGVRAFVKGEALTQLPEDLFIPPDALEVLLESFSGPLDLLLYLIRKQNMDILDIPIVIITQQYLQYIALMEKSRMSLAAEYLVMAALLAEIKSRCLLPVIVDPTEETLEDPRMELVRRLQLYESIKIAANNLDALPRQEREHFMLHLSTDAVENTLLQPDVALDALVEAIREILIREDRLQHHHISQEPLTVRERMNSILQTLAEKKCLLFTELFNPEEGRSAVVVSLLAILELARQALIIITQISAFLPIQIEATKAYE